MFAIYQDNVCRRQGDKINPATFTVCELDEGASISPAGYTIGKVWPIMKGATIDQARTLCDELNKMFD
mgnify:CR=1 FL=1